MRVLDKVKSWFILPEQEIKQKAEGMAQNMLREALFRFANYTMPVMQVTTDPQELLLNTYARNSDVYAIVNLILKGALTVPEILYENNEATSKTLRLARQKQDYFKNKGFNIPLTVFLSKELKEVESGKLLDVMHNPNPTQSDAELKEATLGFFLTNGNAFEYGNGPNYGNNKGLIQEVWSLYPQMTKIIPDKGALSMIKGYELRQSDIIVDYDRVMHLKTWNPLYSDDFSHLYGLPPLYVARYLTSQGNSAYDSMWQILDNAGLKGVFSPDGTKEEGTPQMTPEQIRRFKADLNAKAKSKTESIHYIDQPVKWTPLGLSPVDLDLLQGQLFTKRGLCDVYGVNSALLNDPENKTYNNMAEARKALYTNAVIPLLTRYQKARQRWLIDPYSKAEGKQYILEHDYSVIPELQEDTTKLYQIIEQVSFLTFDEKRSLFNWAEIGSEETTKFYIDSNKQPLDALDVAIQEATKTLGFHKVQDY